ncbi:MAG: 16S rRNA (guanine(527)-N(7))-methyltransferase RsmG, partial [Bacteroidales bacterium]
VSRAVTTLGELVKWVKPLILPYSRNELKNGILYLKGGELKSELRRSKMKSSVYNIPDYYNEDFFETKKLVHLY